jgi:uncharacterized protein
MEKVIKKYIVGTYLIFYCFLLLIGATMFILKSQTLVEILKVISAWSATFVFIIMFRKINPNGSLRSYIKSQFSEKIKISTVVWIVLLQCSIFLGGLIYISTVYDIPIQAQLVTSWGTLLLIFVHMLIGGPLGEELGWRGYVLNELQKKFSPLKSAIIVGVLWGFWHTPLWFLSGYTGIQLVQYIICFLVSIIAITIIMTAFYNLNHNLVIPIIIHQFFNYFMNIQIGNRLDIFVITAILYVAVASILVLINYKQVLYK